MSDDMNSSNKSEETDQGATPTLRPYHDTIDNAIDVLSNPFTHQKLPITEPWFHSDKFPDTIPTWPYSSTAWVSWVERMKKHFESSWKKWNIDKAINLSMTVPASYPTYLYTFLSFWNSDLNCFVFPWGMMGPTLLDVAMITGLPIAGRELPEFHSRQEELSAISLTRKNAQWNAFVAEFQKSTDVATEEEHMAFLLYWLCRYVACVGSKSVVRTYTRYVEAIMLDQPISLGRFFLGLLFQGINRSLKKLANGSNPGTTMTGPWWFMQLWINLYFPELFEMVPASGYLFSYSMSEQEVLRFILHRTAQTEYFYPYDIMSGWPEFLSHPSNTKEEEGVESIAPHWNSILKPHPLMVGYEIKPAKVKNNPIMVELYWPQCLARQLGCQQGIPRQSFMFSDLQLVAGEPISDFQIKEIGKKRGIFQTRHSYLPFKINPSERSEHTKWWEFVRQEIFPEDFDSYLAKVPQSDKIKKKTANKARRNPKVSDSDLVLAKNSKLNKIKKKTTVKGTKKTKICATMADPAQPSLKRPKADDSRVSKLSPKEIEVDRQRIARNWTDDSMVSSNERDNDGLEASTVSIETPSLAKSLPERPLTENGHITSEQDKDHSETESSLPISVRRMRLHENLPLKRKASTFSEITKKPVNLAAHSRPICLVKERTSEGDITNKLTDLIPHQSQSTKKKDEAMAADVYEMQSNNHSQVQAILNHGLDQAVSLIPELQALLVDAAASVEAANQTDIKEKIDQLVLRTTELEGDYPIWKLREFEDRQAFEGLVELSSQKEQLVQKHDQFKRDADLAFSKKESLVAHQAELRRVISKAQAELKKIDVELKVVESEGASAESSAVSLVKEIRMLDERIQKSEKTRKIVATRYQASRTRMNAMEESWAWVKESWQLISSQFLNR